MAEVQTPGSPQEVHELISLLRAEVKAAVPDQNKLEAFNTALDNQEKKNQEMVTALKEKEQKALDLEERFKDLEAEVARKSGVAGSLDYKATPEYKAFNQYCVKGVGGMALEEKQLLRTDIDPQGGYLVPAELDNAIVKKIVEISGMRSICRVRTISGKTLEVPVRNTIPTAAYEGEAETGGESNSTYQSETITPFRQTVTIPITWDMLMDASFDMQAEIMDDGSLAFAQNEGAAFVGGDGVKKPKGFLADTRITDNARDSNSTETSTFTSDDLLLLTGDLKTGYNPIYVFNRRTLAFIRTLKGSDGQYLWQPSLNGPVANTINGFPYLSAIDMPDIGSETIPVAFGDFMRGYTIADRTGMMVIRDEVTKKNDAIVEFNLKRWNTGQVILPEAITVLKTTSA